MNTHILHLETATTNCSVALSKEGILVGFKEQNKTGFRSSDYLHLYVEEVMQKAGITFSDLAGVAVSIGPGSYTGLRIGVSAAKGFCYAHNIPLIAINTLEVLAQQIKVNSGAFLVPMIDARRMEVFTMVLKSSHDVLLPTSAQIITSQDFQEWLPKENKLIFGSGAAKCKEVFNKEGFHFLDEIQVPSARDMVSLVQSKWEKGEFENLAYFEPFYLKDFYTTAKLD